MTTIQARQSSSAAPAPRSSAATAPAPFALSRRGALVALAVLAAALLLLLASNAAALSIHSGRYHVDIGNYRDKVFLDGAYFQESVPNGATYRWTKGDSALYLAQFGAARYALLTLELGERPQPAEARLTLGERPWTTLAIDTRPRRYTLALPPGPPDELAIGIHVPALAVPGDTRQLGVKVDGLSVELARSGVPLPTASQTIAQMLILLAAQLAALRLGWHWRAQALLAAALAVGLAALLAVALPLAGAYLPRLAAAAAALAALTWLALPLAERAAPWAGGTREVRLLWALTLLACAVRLSGVLEPTFGGQDLSLNLSRLMRTLNGQMVIIARSSEFADGQTIYPPGPYLALLPGILLTRDLASLLQGGLALLDGVTCFLTALLARRLGGNHHAGRMALLLYAGNLGAFAAMSFGFSAQIFGQWFTAPLALLLLVADPRRARTWLLAVVLLLFGAFSHIGVAILGMAWVGLTIAIALLRPHRAIWYAAGFLAVGAALALTLLYIDIAAITLSHAGGTVVGRHAGTLFPGATPLLIKGVRLAYSDPGLGLLPLGLLLIARALPTLDRLAAPLAWLLTALFFLLVDLLLAVQVRYLYFALPLTLSAIAIVLGRLASRGRWGRLAAYALALAVTFQGVALWYSATMGQGEISMTPLTH